MYRIPSLERTVRAGRDRTRTVEDVLVLTRRHGQQPRAPAAVVQVDLRLVG